ncbi:dual specificity phosphatase domain-containing protein [Phanerochaete sordida]|uniref:Dual specificity phosphatase domain-containing protein n=1 Tax=Phanerochaete sordida TaxID=48140 RepID=A0A9P3G9D9_9APHY|nr:dual specificity phosphatase domain-containing protein [Phanerochaete sordida]
MPHELDLLSATPNANFDFDDIPSDLPTASASDADADAIDDDDLSLAVPQREGVMGSVSSHSGSSSSLCLDLSRVEPQSEVEQKVHGLDYEPDFLKALPVMHPPVSSYTSPVHSPPRSPSPAPSSSSRSQHSPQPHPPHERRRKEGPAPIRGLTAAQFASMHEQYLTTHAPDSVIFPFLHGLEGDNDAQNAFFVGATLPASDDGHEGGRSRVKVTVKAKVPRFRGLVWVASDEDDVEEYERSLRAQQRSRSRQPPSPAQASPQSADEFEDDEDYLDEDDLDDEDDYSTSSVDDDEDLHAPNGVGPADMPMDIDVDVVGMDVDDDGRAMGVDLAEHNEGSHMHPVAPRNSGGRKQGAQRPALSAIDTGSMSKDQQVPHHAHTHRLSNASTTSTTSTASSFTPPSSTLSSPQCDAAPDTPPTPQSSLPTPEEKSTPPRQQPADEDHVMNDTPAPASRQSSQERKKNVPERVTLTSTFKPRELLCIDRETGETRFVEPRVPEGISLRNFGIQVPIFATLSDIVVYSPRGNTRAALAVATHFAHAIEAKRAQRVARGQTDLLFYNVFVLCATPGEVAKEMPHVVSRYTDEVCGDHQESQAKEGPHRAHTKGTEGLTCSEAHTLSTRQAPPAQDVQQSSKLNVLRANTISFAQREKDEMRELTQASEILTFPLDDAEGVLKEFNASSTQSKWDPLRGQVFLGNASDVPAMTAPGTASPLAEWDFSSNDPAKGLGYDICIECDDMAPFPSQAHMRAAEEHIARLERKWMDKCLRGFDERAGKEGAPGEEDVIPPRPPPPASLVVHLPFPSSVAYSGNSVPPFVNWVETLLRPVEGKVTYAALKERQRREAESRRWPSQNGSGSGRPMPRRSTNAATIGHAAGQGYNYPSHSQFGTYHGSNGQFGGPSSLPPPSAFPQSFLPPSGSQSSYTRMRSTSATHLTSPSTPPLQAGPIPVRTRPLKILVFSADGYTESSSLALCMLMALRKMSLPEAYLELQIEKRRSFFVYPTEVQPMRRVEQRLERERSAVAGIATPTGGSGTATPAAPVTRHGRPAAMSMSFAAGSVHSGFLGPAAAHAAQQRDEANALSSSAPGAEGAVLGGNVRRPRAATLPPPIANVGDHQVWFNDPRFDGSFPSRVLPFLYLGNLNHAANAYMLHALGITHVVSVGECALIPPEHGQGAFQAGLATAKPGSLWIEEREGRIKVLDIKGVCDDGIDSLEPQLPPICEWIDEARREGGKVLVHCRVGVSRSATVTIAYVMKHLNIPLVDAYLIVRSRRLSVLIQPNMRLLYNLLGWEVKLAQERAQGEPARLREELCRCLNWPYLAKEVHALNEKYLRPAN